MSIRVKVSNGVLVPLEPLPAYLCEGVEMEIPDLNGQAIPNAASKTPTEAADHGETWL